MRFMDNTTALHPTRRVAYAGVLTAVGVALAPYTSIPIGIARINPAQHFINVLAAVLLGPGWAVLVAAAIGALRNVMGMGTLLAFPGGMIGAFLAGMVYRRFRKHGWAAAGEIAGTGLIAPVVSALLVAPFLMQKTYALLPLTLSFLCSSVAGALLGIFALRLLRRADII